MASTTISDAVVFPQDEGTGVPDGNEDYDSAGYYSLMAQATGEPYKKGLTLSNLDTTNETVDVAAGHAYVTESGNTVQSGAQTSYDATLPSEMAYLVVLPTSTTVALDTDTDADLDLVVDPTTQDSVTIEHNTSPTGPSLVIGNVDSGSGGTANERGLGPAVGLNKVQDSSGRYLGELTGSNDAQVVIDAMEDRSPGAAVIVPDPGFNLDWEQQVDLVTDEAGFSLETVGKPTLEIPSGFTGTSAFHRPGSTASNEKLRSHHLGSFIIDDSSNNVLDWAIDLLDAKKMDISPPTIRGCPGVRIDSQDNFSTDNRIHGGQVGSARGPAVELLDANTTIVGNLNFSDLQNETETAFIDRGNFNKWRESRAEWAHTVMYMDGAKSYEVNANDWDRNTSYTTSIKEENGASGTIRLTGFNKPQLFDKSIIDSTTTEIVQDGMGPTEDHRKILEYGRHFAKLTGATTFGANHFRTDTSGGSSLGRFMTGAGGAGILTVSTGGSSGDYALITTDTMVDPTLRGLKLITPEMVGASSPGLIQFGFTDNPGNRNTNNRIEWVWDTNDVLGTGGHGTDEWYLDVITGGTRRAQYASGAPATTGTNPMSINWDPANGRVSGSVGINTIQTLSTGGNPPTNDMGFYFRAQAVQDNASFNANWNMRNGMRLMTY